MMTMRYHELSRKEKQLIASEYPYKADIHLWDVTGSNKHQTKKFFNTKEELMDFKEKAAEDGVSLTKRRDFVTGSTRTPNSPTISIIDTILSPMGEEAYRIGLELAEQEFNPLPTAQSLFAIQLARLQKGMQYEDDVDLGLSPETEACMSNLINILKVTNDIVNGQKVDVNLSGSLSSLIMDMDIDDLTDDIIDIGDLNEK